MSQQPTIRFASADLPQRGVLVVLTEADGSLPTGLPADLAEALGRAATLAKFKGRSLGSARATVSQPTVGHSSWLSMTLRTPSVRMIAPGAPLCPAT